MIAMILVYVQFFHDMDPSVAIIILSASSTVSNLFIYCYFGMLSTESFEQMSDYLYYDLNWFEMPFKLQKYLVIMISNMQKPIYYHGFEIAQLSLRTFIQVRIFFLHIYKLDFIVMINVPFFSSSERFSVAT